MKHGLFFLLDPKAASETIRIAAQTGASVWLGSDAITAEEHKRLISEGARITRFSTPMANATPQVIAGALGTIDEHHPNEVVWVQHVASEFNQ
jgi:hypothetical protein